MAWAERACVCTSVCRRGSVQKAAISLFQQTGDSLLIKLIIGIITPAHLVILFITTTGGW